MGVYFCIKLRLNQLWCAKSSEGHARCMVQVVTDILHLQNQKLMTYKGDYDTFERTRDERLRNQQKAHEANERTRGHIQVQLACGLILCCILTICIFAKELYASSTYSCISSL